MGALSRRQFLALSGVAVGGLALAACGGSSGSKSTTATTAAAGAADDVTSRLLSLLQLDKGELAGGQVIPYGAALPLSGVYGFIGTQMHQGIELAVKHIAAAGGPTFQPIYKDTQGVNPKLSTQAIQELGLAKVPMMLTSFYNGYGSMNPGTKQYQILAIDPGAGVGQFTSQDFYWGATYYEPVDGFPGGAQYIKQKYPNAKKAAAVFPDQGAVTNNAYVANLKAALGPVGVDLIGQEFAPASATDFNSVIQRIVSKGSFDLLFASDANFIKQYRLAGYQQPQFASHITQSDIDTAGDSLRGMTFFGDYLSVETPPNPWAQLFVDEFKKANGGKPPDVFGSHMYHGQFVLWDLVRRVKKAGKELTGPNLQDALTSNTTFKCLFGGDSKSVGTFAFDTSNHSVSQYPLGAFEWDGKQVTQRAAFDIGGKNFKML